MGVLDDHLLLYIEEPSKKDIVEETNESASGAGRYSYFCIYTVSVCGCDIFRVIMHTNFIVGVSALVEQYCKCN